MTDTKQLLEYAKQPTLALQNLSELIEQVDSGDESTQNNAYEALENCGPPTIRETPTILQALSTHKPTRIYWASTLFGRMGSEVADLAEWPTIENLLVGYVRDESLELSARERCAWAISEIGKLGTDHRRELESLTLASQPRLQRLILKAIKATE
jgi:hypothetical protein